MEQPRNERGEFRKRESRLTREEKHLRRLERAETLREFSELRSPTKQAAGNSYYSSLYGHYRF
jgi:hypothetical protein